MAKCSRATAPQRRPQGGGQGGSSRTPGCLGQRPRGNRGEKARAGSGEELLIVAEVGGDDRTAGGEINGELALYRIVLPAGESGMHQNVGAREGDDLIGGLAGQ